MSYSISLYGHSNEAHNESVKAVFERAVRDLRKISNDVSGGLSATDVTGSLQITAAQVTDEPDTGELATEDDDGEA